MDIELLKLLVAALGGGLTVKALDIGYQELRRRFERRLSARRYVDENLDPVLKAADELVGKLRSMGGNDFRTLRKRGAVAKGSVGYRDYIGLLYLLARFWASLEVFRRGGLSVSIAEDDRGEKLGHFIDCMESRRLRLVDRLSQRAVAELVLRGDEDGGMVAFIDFVRLFESDEETQRWVEPLATILDRMQHTSARQRLLQYGVVVHAMVDTLDPGHKVSRDRPSYPHKLSKRTRGNLKYRVFGVYLKFVSGVDKYLGPAKRGGTEGFWPPLGGCTSVGPPLTFGVKQSMSTAWMERSTWTQRYATCLGGVAAAPTTPIRPVHHRIRSIGECV